MLNGDLCVFFFKKNKQSRTELNRSEHITQNKGKNHVLKFCFVCLAVSVTG